MAHNSVTYQELHSSQSQITPLGSRWKSYWTLTWTLWVKVLYNACVSYVSPAPGHCARRCCPPGTWSPRQCPRRGSPPATPFHLASSTTVTDMSGHQELPGLEPFVRANWDKDPQDLTDRQYPRHLQAEKWFGHSLHGYNWWGVETAEKLKLLIRPYDDAPNVN